MADRSQTEALFGKTLNPDGTLRAVSPSQSITFKRCGLRWHFEKKGKLAKKPMGRGADIGDKAHKRMDRWLSTGEDVRGPLELVGAEMIAPYLWAAPFKKGPGLVEGALLNPRLTTPGGVLITGYFDFYVPSAGTVWPIVIDHKFKKDLIKWGYYIGPDAARLVTAAGGDAEKRTADDEEKLKDDPQTLIYGAWALARQPEAGGVIVRHHQHQTEGEGGRFPLPAEVRLTRDELLRRWGALAATIDGPMVEASKVPAAPPGETPDGVPFNDMACGDFGGCDFARVCKHSPSNRFATLLRGSTSRAIEPVPPTSGATTMSLLTQVGLTSAAPSPATPQTAEQTTALLTASIKIVANESAGHPGVPFMTDMKIDALKSGVVYIIPGGAPAKFEAILGSRAIFRAKDGGLREVAADATVKTVDEETLCLFEGRPYQKPAAPAAPAPTPAAPAAMSAEKTEKKRKLGIVDVTESTPTTPPDVAPSPSATPAPAPAAQTATAAPEVKVTTAEAIAPPAEKKPKAKKADAEPQAGDTLMLLVNCDCSKATDLAGYVASTVAALAQKHGTPDIRLARKESDLAFGGWKACLAIEVAKNPPKGLCSIRSSELADPVIETLVPLAAVVVRGGGR